ncbi:pilus assembly protein PilZ [Methylobacterium sp. BTF04]|uniref:pilus assembly protein PilZ n=1 Tax=Methylobacterium sp. BTF04 TaxID=2708300 RepID=UPI0013D58542|nr:pilus assembly protein PilZ [Methylobacterium sp. BTF04]NEU14856.1 pilus assembly protein PilZ [Methylobacterium sp. BTF04]
MLSSERAEIFSSKNLTGLDEGHIVNCHIDEIGSISGIIGEINSNFMTIVVQVSAPRRERINARLKWIKSREKYTSEQRLNQRILPIQIDTLVHFHNIRDVKAQIIDLSMSGASLAISIKPDIGSLVTVGKRFANVVRHTDEGFAVSFRLPFSPVTFNESVIL